MAKNFGEPKFNEPVMDDNGFFTHFWVRWLLSIYNNSACFAKSAVNFFGYDSDGGTLIDADGDDIPISSEVVKDSYFSHSTGSTEVTINTTGTYEVIIESSFNINEGDVVELALYRDTGSGHAVVEGAVSYCGA